MIYTRFTLGEEQNLESHHIGQVAYIDHHVRRTSKVVGAVPTAYAWELRVHIGVIAGVVERRGIIIQGVDEEKPGDSTEYPDSRIEIILADGRIITVEDKDHCSVWFPSLEQAEAAA